MNALTGACTGFAEPLHPIAEIITAMAERPAQIVRLIAAVADQSVAMAPAKAEKLVPIVTWIVVDTVKEAVLIVRIIMNVGVATVFVINVAICHIIAAMGIVIQIREKHVPTVFPTAAFVREPLKKQMENLVFSIRTASQVIAKTIFVA